MTHEQIKFLSQDMTFLRALEVAVTKAAQNLSTDTDEKKKLLATQVLNNSIWARDKFKVNAAIQVSTSTSIEVNEDGKTFTYLDMAAFDTALDNAMGGIWSAEAGV